MNSAAITSIGSVTVAGVGAPKMWEALLNGRVLARQQGGEEGLPEHLTARAPDSLALENHVLGLSYPRPSRTTILAMAAAQECWQMARVNGQIDHDRTGCAMSRNFGQHDVVAQYNQVLWEKGPAAVSGLQFVQTIGNTALGKVSLDLRLRGPSLLNFGAPVLGPALDILRDGDADLMLVGGVDELSLYALTRVVLGGMAVSGKEPSGPYDVRRNALLPSEGAAFLVLERPEFAKARDRKPLGYLCGHATVTDQSTTSFRRTTSDVAECIRRALHDADLAPSDISFVCGAGTGLPEFDDAELLALKQVFPTPPPVYSCKGALGETWGASAYLSLISVLQSFAGGMAPPTAGTHQVEQSFRVPVIIESPMSVEKGAALAISFDMSGQNSAYILSEVP